MPASKLSTLFRSSIKKTTAAATAAAAEDCGGLKQFVSSLDTTTSRSLPSCTPKREKSHSLSTNFSSLNTSLSQSAVSKSVKLTDDSRNHLTVVLSSILQGDISEGLDASSNPLVNNDKKGLQKVLDIPWFSSIANNNVITRKKEILRDRKRKWVYKGSLTNRFDRLVKMCAQKLGTDATIQVFGKLGRETGVKEYNALMGACIEKARSSCDDEVSLEQIYKAYGLLQTMRERGFPIDEETFGPFLMYLIDMCMIEEFQFFCGVVRDANPNSLQRLAYYEMLMWIGVNNAEKIHELCSTVMLDDYKNKSGFRESYLLALCKSDYEREFLLLLKKIDLTYVSSMDHLATIFTSLGKRSLESLAEAFILKLKACDTDEHTSNHIYGYAIAVPNLVVKDVVLKFRNLHTKLKVKPSSLSYEKLIKYCCDLHKVHVALDLVDQMFEAGLSLSSATLNSILSECEESYEYNLVHQIYSVICRHKLKANHDTFRIMINLFVKMKDFEGAYCILKDLEAMSLAPTPAMYNAIMAGYFREKNYQGGLLVLKQMEDAGVRPDSQTYSYLITNSQSQDDIVKYYEELKHSGVPVVKSVYMALINAYAACGHFEKAKQVVSDGVVPLKNLNEIKSVLASALAAQGQISDALQMYEEIKQNDGNLEPKSILCLIEHIKSEGELSRLLQLLEQVQDPGQWIDGCYKIISYCVRYKQLSAVVSLLKQLKDKMSTDELAAEVLLDEVFCQIAEEEPADLQLGLGLLQAIKKELSLKPSRKSLDFLLSACVGAKDLKSSFLIWREYRTAGLPYNILSFVRMYQALLASSDFKSAANILDNISKDDPHIWQIIKACQATFKRPAKKKEKQKQEVPKGSRVAFAMKREEII